MGSERITSKVGNSGIFSSSPVEVLEQQAKYTLQTGKIKECFDSLGVQYKGIQQTGGLVSSNPSPGADLYFYHPDHLGSSSLITDIYGALVQHIQYVPFGEVFVEETKSAWSTPYKFNAKELDDETGLYYYGARYYDPRTSVWLSVDPLAGKYPNISSYVYCVNNPVKFVDPDGREIKNTRKMVLSNRTLIEKLNVFDRNVAKHSGKDVNSYIFEITGGDRYKKQGKIYSATNHKEIKQSAKKSTHLQENGATGVDLSHAEGISYEVLEISSKEAGLRLDPSGKYNDGHFHLDIKDYPEEMKYEKNNYIPNNDDFNQSEINIKNDIRNENQSNIGKISKNLQEFKKNIREIRLIIQKTKKVE